MIGYQSAHAAQGVVLGYTKIKVVAFNPTRGK